MNQKLKFSQRLEVCLRPHFQLENLIAHMNIFFLDSRLQLHVETIQQLKWELQDQRFLEAIL